MIGTEALADLILNATRGMKTDEWGELNTETMPEGWTYLGSGAYRHAFKGPDGYVYKVSISGGDRTNENQCLMLDTYGMRKKFEGFRFATLHWFANSNVQVSEFVEGTHPVWTWEVTSAFSQKVRASLDGMPFLDIHGMNVIESNGEFVIIDW